MSGGSGGGYYIPTFRKNELVSCERLVVETVLMRPNEELIAELQPKQVLTVHINDNDIIVMFGDQVAGVIETPHNQQIIKCMEVGTFYVAEILSIQETICKVKIHALQL